MPKINRIDHLCIAVKDLEQAKKQWAALIGRDTPDDEYIDEGEKIKVARYYLGEVGLELMESTTEDGEVARFVESHGEGIMLLSLNVDSTAETVKDVEAKDYPVIGGLRNFRNCQFAFIHPKATNGVLLEYIDDKDPPKKA